MFTETAKHWSFLFP